MGAFIVVATVVHDEGGKVEHRQWISRCSHPSGRPQSQHIRRHPRRGCGPGDVVGNRWESVAGSSGDHVALLASSLSQEVDLTITHWQLQEDVTFVPHESALGGPNSPWDAVSTAPITAPREDHASLPIHHRGWLLDQLDAVWAECVPLFHQPGTSETVVLGTEGAGPQLIHSTWLAEGDTLWIADTSAPCQATPLLAKATSWWELIL